jgi:hypothetical protein
MIIVGSARSGTSWISELFALQYRYRMLFEPEHEFNTAQGKLICDRYLSKTNNSPAIIAYFKRIFSNRIDCDWIAQISNRKWKRHLWPFIPKKYIIKFVRCNLATNYMTNEFEIPVLFVIRNPYDVLVSQCQVKFPWLLDLSWFKGQDALCDLIYREYDYDLREERELTDFETLCLRWCIENSIPFLNNQHDFKVVRYEAIKEDIGVFLDICKAYGLKPLSNIDSVFSKPSSKTHKKSDIITGKVSKRALSSEQYIQLNTFLDIFKIDLYEREY